MPPILPFAAAPGGDGFVLAWIERTSDGAAAAYSRLDADLNPSSPLVVPTRNLSISAPPIVRSGKTTWLTADTSVWQIRADGSLSGPLDGGIMASDMAVTTEFPQLVSGITRATNSFTCRDLGCTAPGGPFRGYCDESCRIYQIAHSYGLAFTALYSASTIKTLAFSSDTKPAIRSDGHDALTAWFVGPESNRGLVYARLGPTDFAHFSQATDDSRVLATFASDSDSSRPDIASDADRYLVVWRTVSLNHDHDIVGASVDRNGRISSFPIATSLDDERDPSVIALGSGTFLVAYEKSDSAGQRRLAGRLVTFASRSRAAR